LIVGILNRPLFSKPPRSRAAYRLTGDAQKHRQRGTILCFPQLI